jgi:enediyne biosynthesis protein E4
LAQFNSFSTGACFGDINADGYPDLYVGNYFTEYPGDLSTVNDNMIVSATQITEGYLFLNEKGKSFKNVYKDWGLNHKGFGFGGLFTDFDNDGDQDLFINHDFGYKRTPNLIYENKGNWRKYKEVGAKLGMDLKINAMTSAAGDYNNDGLMDYFITNIRFNKFMVNQGVGKPFKEMSRELGLGYIIISWGANFVDFDHDGDLDLFSSNGDLNPNCSPMGNHYFDNINGKFEEKARIKGLSDFGIGRGSVVFDLENDGDMDILVVSQNPILPAYPVPSFTHLFRNDSAQGNWIKIHLKGIEAETHGLGSKVEIILEDKKMIREIDGGGSSHLSQNATYAHFGLGGASKIDKIIVHWAGGKKQILTNIDVNQVLTIMEEKTVWWAASWLWITVSIALLSVLFYFFKKKKG